MGAHDPPPALEDELRDVPPTRKTSSTRRIRLRSMSAIRTASVPRDPLPRNWGSRNWKTARSTTAIMIPAMIHASRRRRRTSGGSAHEGESGEPGMRNARDDTGRAGGRQGRAATRKAAKKLTKKP
jgi:hypothetical protein